MKQAFNETFQDQNKGAIIAELMLEAVERARRRQLGHEAIAKTKTEGQISLLANWARETP